MEKFIFIELPWKTADKYFCLKKMQKSWQNIVYL